jgi:hypothetical protein
MEDRATSPQDVENRLPPAEIIGIIPIVDDVLALAQTLDKFAVLLAQGFVTWEKVKVTERDHGLLARSKCTHFIAS